MTTKAISRQDEDDIAILSGLDSQEVHRLFDLYDDERMALVRASEICHRKTHYINNPTTAIIERLARRPDGSRDYHVEDRDAVESSPAGLRMHLGNAIESWLVHNVLIPHYGWGWEQLSVAYYDETYRALMLGHMDGIASMDGSLPMVGEVKSTSNGNFQEVIAAIDYDYEVSSELLEKYLTQMRTYAAMLWLSGGPFERDAFTPFRGLLAIVNRDDCDYEVREVKLFEEDADIEMWLRYRIRLATGGLHPLDQSPLEVPTPQWASASHPICQSCKFNIDCWGSRSDRRQPVDNIDAEVWVEKYEEGSRLTRLGEIYKKGAKEFFGKMLDNAGRNKLQLTDKASVSRYTREGSTRVDTDKLKADKLYDKYTKTGKAYDVIRVNTKR